MFALLLHNSFVRNKVTYLITYLIVKIRTSRPYKDWHSKSFEKFAGKVFGGSATLLKQYSTKDVFQRTVQRNFQNRYPVELL